jgi:hypothetical protein
MQRIMFVGVLTLGLLAGCTTTPTLNDVPATLSVAKTPTDHQRLAAFFEDKAKRYEAEAAQHDRWADQYQAGAGTGGRADRGFAMAAHCRQLRDQFLQAAEQSRMLARAHVDIATSLR